MEGIGKRDVFNALVERWGTTTWKLIIDNATLIHVGASLNYLGKRCFAFSTLDAEFIPDIMARVP